ncbi:MAG: hydrogenase small subunit [Peptococcaceae bacterium]|nr:hydrogenase small subunit [Peptococcaceae bacterium]
MQDSCYQQAVKRGVTRRDFLKLCTATAAMLGLGATAVPKIVQALEANPPVSVIYLNLQECTCCSESFIRSGHPLASELILDLITLEYMDVLQAGAGSLAENAKERVIHKGGYLLVVEGSVPTAADGVYCTIGGKTCEDLLKEAAAGAIAVVAYGTCATDGCVQGSAPNPTSAQPVHKILANDPDLKDTPVIKVPGCPPISEVITGTIVQYLTFGKLPELTPEGRPMAFYSHTIHETCNRRAFFDMGLFVRDFDDEGARQGWCLYLMGCRGPRTKNACAITGWNEGTSYPIKSGHPCLGCSEDKFYDQGPFYTTLEAPDIAPPKDYTPHKVVAATGVSLAVGGALGTLVGTSLFNAYKKKKSESPEEGGTVDSDESEPKTPGDDDMLCK